MNSIKRSFGLFTNRDLQSHPVQQITHTKEDQDEDSSAKVKLKLMSMWNNVKYGKAMFSVVQSSSGSFSGQFPVWLLGTFYHRKSNSDQYEKEEALQSFHSDFSSRIWLTYRREFDHFEGTTINTDCGWGCMIRSGQMLVANALTILHLGRHWRMNNLQTQEDEILHRSIIRLFGDKNCDALSPFSIHKLMSIASMILDKHPGDWFGPAATAHILKAAVAECKPQISPQQSMMSNLKIYVAQDTTVYIQDILDLCEHSTKEACTNFEEELGAESFAVLSRSEIDDEPIEALDLSDCLVDPVVPYLFELGERGFVNVERGYAVDSHDQLQSESPKFCNESGFIKVLKDEVPVLDHNSSKKFLDSAASKNYSTISHNNYQAFCVSSKLQKRSSNADEDFSNLPNHCKEDKGPKQKGLYPSLSREISQEKNLNPSSNEWLPVLVLIPVRLGTSKLNPIYYPCLQTILADPNCVGIIGGRPKHSLYFLGFQEDNLIHLDPHLVQDKVDVYGDNFSLDSFHCLNPRKMTMSKMDPSCCFGFLLSTKHQFLTWCDTMRKLRSQSRDYTVFTVQPGRSQDVEKFPDTKESMVFDETFDVESPGSSNGIGTEDFVFL